jgi:transposase InsO family protein
MNAPDKIARERLSVLELAEALQNVSAACRHRGMTRTQFYEYKRRCELQGLAGLIDLPPIHKTHPQTTSLAVIERLLALSLPHPAWGCVRLSAHLKLEGISVSSPTIPSILIKHAMGTRFQRLLKLEEQLATEPSELCAEQMSPLENANPCLRERHVESSRPGALRAQDTFFVGTFKGVGKIYLPTVVDPYGSYAFGLLHTRKVPQAAVAVRHNDVLPFYRARTIPVDKVLTDNGREFCGTDSHPFELYLALNDLTHQRTTVRHPHTNGFVERFHRTAKEECFEVALRETCYEAVRPLQADWDRWLTHYNTERPTWATATRASAPSTLSTPTYLSRRKPSSTNGEIGKEGFIVPAYWLKDLK